MGNSAPFLYDPVGVNSPYHQFDPRAVSRASITPKPPRPKQEGPLVSFNKHPDSYLILPLGQTDVMPMNPSVKKWVKWVRIIQLVLRCAELLCALGLLALMILIKNVDASTGWIMRIVPGVAILHTVYGIYHLGRKPSGRTPASSASYMLFASFFDVSIIPFYAFSAMIADTQTAWSTLLPNGADVAVFAKVVFLLATIGGGLHLLSLGFSLYLAVTFRKITKLPPDMNPLEDNLTSRHKRNKSSVSTAASANMSQKRLSTPLETKRSSGAAYEDLSRPPTIPFFSTRNISTDSFSTYRTTPPPSRDSRQDLPSRQYQIKTTSARSSMADLKRTPGYTPSIVSNSPKRASYSAISMADDSSSHHRSSGASRLSDTTPAIWSTADSLSSKSRSRTTSPQKPKYKPLHQRDDSFENHPNPLELNPPSPGLQPPKHFRGHRISDSSPLSEISNNRNFSGDIGDISLQSAAREVEPTQLKEVSSFKAQYYGELRPGTPPIMVGGSVASRQVSSGNDYHQGSTKGLGRRDVSGKVAEEGRGGALGGWGTRFTKISGFSGL